MEDFAEACWHDEMDHVGIVHRIQSVPTSSLRGIQVQQSAAHYAVQMLMGAEPSCEQVFDTVHLIGKVSVLYISYSIEYCDHFILFLAG